MLQEETGRRPRQSGEAGQRALAAGHRRVEEQREAPGVATFHHAREVVRVYRMPGVQQLLDDLGHSFPFFTRIP